MTVFEQNVMLAISAAGANSCARIVSQAQEFFMRHYRKNAVRVELLAYEWAETGEVLLPMLRAALAQHDAAVRTEEELLDFIYTRWMNWRLPTVQIAQ